MLVDLDRGCTCDPSSLDVDRLALERFACKRIPLPDGTRTVVYLLPGRGVPRRSSSLVAMARWARQKVVPHLSYTDPFAALDWLGRVFGFTEAKRFDRGENNLTARPRGPDGGVVMISGSDDEFKVWMRERAPRFEEVTGRS